MKLKSLLKPSGKKQAKTTPQYSNLAINFYIESILRMAVILINTAMISRTDPLLLASTSAANQLFMLCGVLFSLTASGCAVLIAQSLGASKFTLANAAFSHAFCANAIFGALSLGIVLLFAPEFLALLNTPANTLEGALIYLHFMAYVIAVDALSWVLSATLRAHGFAASITICVALMNITTIALNAGFLYGYFNLPHWGLYGVGLSNLLGRCICLIGYLFIFYFIAKLPFNLLKLHKISRKIIAKLLYVGGFNAASNLLSSLQYLVVFSLIARLGSQMLALQTMYYQICFFIFAPAAALSGANQILCAHNIGARNLELVLRQTRLNTLLCCAFSLLFIAAVYIFHRGIFSALNFTPSMLASASSLLAISCFMEPIRAYNMSLKSAFAASADVRYSFIVCSASAWLIALPIAYFASIKWALFGIWLGFLADEIFQSFLHSWRYFSRKFLAKKLI